MGYDERSDVLVVCDSLLDYLDKGAGWTFSATSLIEPFSITPEEGELLPAEVLKERTTPDAHRVAGPLDRTGYFRAGKDLWHPGHDVGLRLHWRSPAAKRLKLRLVQAPINSWVTSFGTCAAFHNRKQILFGRCEASGFVELSQVVSVREGDVLDIVFGYDGSIDNMECLYRATLEEDALKMSASDIFLDGRKASATAPLVDRLAATLSRELDAHGARFGQAGFFSARER